MSTNDANCGTTAVTRKQELLREHLSYALDDLIAARLLASSAPSPPEAPGEAIDAALTTHQGFNDARREANAALERIRVVLGEGRTDLFLDLEARTNALIAQAADAAWAAAWMVLMPRRM